MEHPLLFNRWGATEAQREEALDPLLARTRARSDTDWILLAQFDIEAVDREEEHGVAYWLMKPDDLAALRFAKAVSTIQAH